MSSSRAFLAVLSLIIAFALALPVFSQPYGTGCLREDTIPSWIIPSPPIDLVGQYDDFVDLSPNFPPINSQGGQGSCTAWATAYYYKTYQEWQEHGWDLSDPDHQFSPAFVYNQINGGGDNGSYPSDAFKLLIQQGCTPWSIMPYTDQNCTAQPSEEAYYNAIPYRSQEVYSIDLFAGLDDIKNHLLNGNAAVFAFTVWDNFNNISNYNNIYCVSQIYGTNPGGHAVTFCGFDDNLVTADGVGAFKVANSWGASWGDGGYFWMSYEAVQDPITCWGTAYYCSDRIGYEPTVLSIFRVEHDDRYAILYEFGVGDSYSPLWSQDFFDWYMSPQTALPYASSNVIVDLTDAVPYLEPGIQNPFYMSCDDRRPWNSLDGSIVDFNVAALDWPSISSAGDLPVVIPDNGTDAVATLEITQGTCTPVGGSVTGTWTPENNPYYVMGDLIISESQILTIEPGTEVIFLDYYKFDVLDNANLQAVGTADDPIVFSPLISAVGWGGIRFLGASDESRMEYCHLEYGKATGSGAEGCGGAIFCAESDPDIRYCQIENCKAEKGGAIYCENANPEIFGNTIVQNSASESGGGIYCLESDPTITENSILQNTAHHGGGIYCEQSDPMVQDNQIEDNVVTAFGGGIACSGSSPEISDNSIIGNSAAQGGGIGSIESDPVIQGNTFSENDASQGGAVYCKLDSALILDNAFNDNTASSGGAIHGYQAVCEIAGNTIQGNSSGNGGGLSFWECEVTSEGNAITENDAGGFGGGIYLLNTHLNVINNLVCDNEANNGGGVYLLNSSAVFMNATVSRNDAYAAAGGFYCAVNSEARLLNSIIQGNSPGGIHLQGGSSCQAKYCNVQGGWEGEGNINSNPMFMDWTDYHLADWSPSIGAGMAVIEVDGTAYYAPSSDLDGNDRPAPAGSDPDQGAYEHSLGIPAGVASEDQGQVPTRYALYQNAPNPFNPETVIRFDLPHRTFVNLSIYDVAGRLVAKLAEGFWEVGCHDVIFDAGELSSGVYIYRLSAGDFGACGKMILLK